MELIANRFEIKRRLGTGAFGEVYQVVDRRNGDILCLKMLKRVDRAFEVRHANEFELLARLEHPGLIKVYEYGIDQAAGLYFTMEYASGGDLGSRLPLTPAEFFRAFGLLCSALAYIHRRGLVHGDLKPQNVLIDSAGCYRLSDFGLSAMGDSAMEMKSVGSIMYMAPEVLSKTSFSPSADIYSLGLLAVEMISGKPAYCGSTEEIISSKIRGEHSLPPIAIEYGGEELAGILRKMTKSSPADRYRDIGQVLDDCAGAGFVSGPVVELRDFGKSPFIGRKEELQWLESGLEAWRSKQTVAYFIGGESGVGKSRLLDEFRMRCQLTGLRFYRVYCRENDLRPFSSILKILNQMISELDPQLERLALYGPDLKRLFPERFAGIAIDLTETEIKSVRRRLLDNLQRYLGELSIEGNAVLAVEDIQFADDDSSDFLKSLFQAHGLSGSRAVYIICTAQTQKGEPRPDFVPGQAEQLRLLPAADSDSWQAYLESHFNLRDLPDNFSLTLHSETGGNYFLAGEVLKELIHSRVLKMRAGGWELDGGWAEKINISLGVKSLLEKRFSHLDPSLRPLLAFGSALGRSFLEEEMVALAGRPWTSRLDELIESGVFAKITFGPGERIDFAHGLLRRAAYELLNEDDRRTYHAKIGEHFERLGDRPEFLGHHYFSAGLYDKAYSYLLESARNAESIFAYRKAAQFYRSALLCLERSASEAERSHERIGILMALGKALDFLSPSEATEILLEATELAFDQSGDGTEIAPALLALGNNYLHIGDIEKAVSKLSEAVDISRKAEQMKIRGEAELGLGFAYDKAGKLDEAEKAYLEALDLFSEIDYPEASCRVLNYMGIIRKRRGDFGGAMDFYNRAMDISLQRGFQWLSMNLFGNMGNLYLAQSDFERALNHYTKSLEVAKEISDHRIESINLLNTGNALNELGKLDQAERRFREAIDKFRELGDKGSEAITLNNLGLLHFKRGEVAKALEQYSRGMQLARSINQPRAELANRIGLAEVFLGIGDFERARAEVVVATAQALAINDVEQRIVALAISSELNFEWGRIEDAKKDLDEFLALGEAAGDPLHRAKILLVGTACGIVDQENAELRQLHEKDHRIEPISMRFKAMSVLQKGPISNPEIWVARLGDALTKAKALFLPADNWRLSALRMRFLDMLGEKIEISRQRDALRAEIAKSLSGIEPGTVENLFRVLKIREEKGDKGGEDKMRNVSREERLEVLIRVARTINTIRELDPLLNKIMDLALETLGGERGFIMMFGDSDEKSLEPVVARNLAREDILNETTISHSSAMDVARMGKPLLIGRADHELSARQSVIDFSISSILCAPLAVKGEILGIVYVDNRSGITYTNDDLDFLVSFSDLAAIAIENARLSERLSKKNVYLQKQVESIWGFGNIVGHSPAMQNVFRMAESVAETDVTVVIAGESGTGKELLARAIHYASLRKNNRFMPVDCGAMAESLLESELFGYIKGAFTGAASDREGLIEIANGGTVFLDEISNTSKNFQAKLLRLLQENEIRRVGDNRIRRVDVRIIAATNKDLEQEVKAGNFREDLFYRLNVVDIALPPLRERPEDIPLLANYFLEKICAKMKLPVKNFSPGAIDSLVMYSWPGNVRQLENTCERVVIFSKENVINPEDLPAEINSLRYTAAKADHSTSVPRTKSELKAEKMKMDRLFLVNLLTSAAGNVMEASRLSGMDRSQIHHLMSRFGLTAADFKSDD